MAVNRALFVAVLASVRLAHADDPPLPPAPIDPSPATPPPISEPPVSTEPPLAPPTQTPPSDPASALREANLAATAGDWSKVATFVQPLLARALEPTDLGEAHRLAGLAAFFGNHLAEADAHFLAYLKIDLDGHLDPALYPPEAINFFNDVKAKHDLELKALRPTSKRHFVLNLVPPFGQFQNGDRVKGIIVGTALGAFLVTNVATYLVIRSWCHNDGSTCDDSGTNHFRRAQQLGQLNVFAGISAIATYVYGVWDSVSVYRRHTREDYTPYVVPTNDGAMIGVSSHF